MFMLWLLLIVICFSLIVIKVNLYRHWAFDKSLRIKKSVFRLLIAKVLVVALEPDKSVFKIFDSKSIRKYGHGKANPYLKGIYKPLKKYAETGRLKIIEVL